MTFLVIKIDMRNVTMSIIVNIPMTRVIMRISMRYVAVKIRVGNIGVFIFMFGHSFFPWSHIAAVLIVMIDISMLITMRHIRMPITMRRIRMSVLVCVSVSNVRM